MLNDATGESIPDEISDNALSPVPTGRPPYVSILTIPINTVLFTISITNPFLLLVFEASIFYSLFLIYLI